VDFSGAASRSRSAISRASSQVGASRRLASAEIEELVYYSYDSAMARLQKMRAKVAPVYRVTGSTRDGATHRRVHRSSYRLTREQSCTVASPPAANGRM